MTSERVESPKDESPETWTDRLAHEGAELGVFRQCSIGWHEECSDPAGEDCRCGCHQYPPHP